jgi:hypothetical protein
MAATSSAEIIKPNRRQTFAINGVTIADRHTGVLADERLSTVYLLEASFTLCIQNFLKFYR